MPTYTYEALTAAGKAQKGSIQAANSEEATARIKSQGLFLSSPLREMKVKKKSGAPGAQAAPARGGGARTAKKKGFGDIQINIGGVSTKDLTTLTRQFSTLQDAGLPILRSLQVLEAQQKPGLLKDILTEVAEDVSAGSTLSDAMSRHPKAFDKLYCKMIAAGEVAGVLEMILKRLADFLEKAARLKRKIVGAMIYPAVVISVAAIIVFGIMIFIVPKFIEIFDQFDTELPWLTLFLINTSKWIGGPILVWVGAEGNEGQIVPGLVWLLLLPIVAWMLIKLIRKSEGGKFFIDAVVLKAPIFGKLVEKATIAKFTRTLGTLIHAGVPILDSLNITRETTGNAVYQRALLRVHDSVRQGDSFAEPLRQTKVCDSIVTNMIDVGEETGELDKMLEKIAENYDDEVDTMVASLVSLLEPIMVVILGVIVGGIVVALFLPMVALIQTVGQ
ncbi:MAG: type II secretion system F family protein [Phycisphaeraceae bacterium]|nr:type II secretion system F family protein [Phycisphaeraceae bacterium]